MNGAIWRIRQNWRAACLRACGNWMQRGQPSSFVPCRRVMGFAWAFATACSRPPVNLVDIRRFIEIFYARLIDQRPQSTVPHFDRIAVVPLDRALDLLPVFQYKNHHSPAMNLLLKVERLCVRTLPAGSCGIRTRVTGEGRRD